MKLLYGVGVETTETFRWAMYSNPQGYGLNAQTLPKALRFYLEPPKGRIFVGGDLSQVEARVVAYLSKCRALIECFNDPKRSVHLENALAVFGRPVEKDTPEYVLAKAVIHASNYREGPQRFSVQTGLPVARAKELLKAYHSARPEIHVWHKWVWDQIKRAGTLINPLGDQRTFYEAIACFSATGKMADTHWKDAISWVPQSTTPHVLNIGLLAMRDLRDSGMDLQFHHQGHDSFLLSVPIGEEVRFFDAVAPVYAGIVLTTPGGKFTVPMEYHLGYNFCDMFGYRGSCLSRSDFDNMVNAKLAKKPREQHILEGAYGALLKDWRPYATTRASV